MAANVTKRDELAERITARLFVNGFGERATRLAMRDGATVWGERDLGGWSRLAVLDAVRDELDLWKAQEETR